MLNSLFHTAVFSIQDILMVSGFSLFLGLVIAKCYMMVGAYRKNFVLTLAILPLLVSMIIMIVNGNVGASVAVLGAFGLVRFRSAPGSAKDIGFIFFTMAIGLIVGMGYLSLAALMTAIIGGCFVLFTNTTLFDESSIDRSLRITVPEDLNYVGAFDAILSYYTTSYKLTSVKTTNMGTMFELKYDIILKDQKLEKEFIDELRCRNGNLTILLGLSQRDKEEL